MNVALATEEFIAPAPVNSAVSEVKGIPFFGIGHKIKRDPLNFLSKLANQSAPLIKFEHMGLPVYLVNSPEGAEFVLQTGHKFFQKGQFYNKVKPMFGKGLPVLEGEDWRRHRQLMQPSFRVAELKRIADLSIALAQAVSEKWLGKKDSVEIDVDNEMAKLTVYVVAQALFGAEIDKHADTLVESVDTLLSISELRIWAAPDLHWHWGSPYYWKFKAARHAMDKVIHEFVERRKHGETFGGDLLGLLLGAMSNEENASITDEELRDEITTLIVTGHESTANTLTWMFYEMAKNPAIQARVYEEIKATFEDGIITPDQYDGMVYTKAVISETMRLYPAVWSMARKNLEEVTIHDVMISANSNFMLSPYIMQRHRKYYSNPEAFLPERFLNGEMERQHKFIYLPFAAGPRRCIGEKFAWQEMLSIVSVLCQKVRFELAPGQKVEPVARVSVKPAYGMNMVVSAR
jgi:cytochrome P450